MRHGTILLAVLSAAAAVGAPPPARAHDWYTGLRAPTGERCCNGEDCRPVDHRYDPRTGRLEVGIEGVWVAVDPDRLVPTASADGGAHACYWRSWAGRKMTPVLRCVILPGEV